MDILIELLAEIVLEAAFEISGKKKYPWYLRLPAFLILLLMVALTLFILYGLVSLTIIGFGKQDMKLGMMMLFCLALVVVGVIILGMKLVRRVRQNHQEQ